MSNQEPTNAEPEFEVKALGTDIHRDGADWCLTELIDGRPHVVSRHATEEQARQASRQLNSSANRRPGAGWLDRQ